MNAQYQFPKGLSSKTSLFKQQLNRQIHTDTAREAFSGGCAKIILDLRDPGGLLCGSGFAQALTFLGVQFI
jgi:hypothetical protein